MIESQSTTSLRLHPSDDVAIAIAPMKKGGAAGNGVILREPVASGHKVALRNIARGEVVLKYGQVIGVASADISAGDHVHSHNLAFVPSSRRVPENFMPAQNAGARGLTFKGYKRPAGRAGTRNFIGILTSVNCSATVAKRIAAYFDGAELPAGIDGVAAFTHTGGCGTPRAGDGVDNLTRTIMGYARNPNFAAVIVIGLGCEVNQIDRMLGEARLERSDRLQTFTIQDEGGSLGAIERGKGIVADLIVAHGGAEREEVSVRDLMVGLQCGGSDGWSGVTANPALGAAADLLVAEGGTVILSETPEIYGAEHLLLARAANREAADALIARLDWWEAYAEKHGADLNNNPSPGNLAGGLTTILEKSLGAVAKSGSSPLQGVYRYAEPIDRAGFVFMDSPGYDPCSATGQIASGANIVAFTTGRGSVFGSKPSPCLKLASNAELARRMAEDMDIDCSAVLDGTSVSEMGDLIFAQMISVASGAPTRSELNGLGDHEFVPWQLGAWM